MALSDHVLGPCTLEGRFVRLEPLRSNHAAALTEIGRGMDWGWMLAPLRSREEVNRRMEDGLRAEERKEEYVVAVVRKRDAGGVRSTAYFGIVPNHKRDEIRYTW